MHVAVRARGRLLGSDLDNLRSEGGQALFPALHLSFAVREAMGNQNLHSVFSHGQSRAEMLEGVYNTALLTLSASEAILVIK